MKNYYQILEISENASSEIIEKAYKVLAKRYHPDTWPKDKLYLAEIKFKEITEAYKILSNPVSKYNYDIQLANYITSLNQNYYNTQNNNDNNNNNNDDSATYSEQKNTKKKRNIIPNYIPHFKSLFSDLKSFLENESKQPKEERSKHKKALILTFIIVFIIILLFIRIPFLNKFIFP